VFGVLGPGPRQVQGAVDQVVTAAGGVGQLDRDLGVLDPPGGAGVFLVLPPVDGVGSPVRISILIRMCILLELVVHATIYDMTAAVRAEAMTSDEVARLLGVSARQVQRLVETGELLEAGRVGRSLLIDAVSVNLLQAKGSQRGRPWNARTVWTALDLLSGVASDAMSSSQRWHLRERMKTMTAADLVRVSRHRADVHRFRASDSFLPRIRDEVALTAATALTADAQLARCLGLAAGGRSSVDGYVGRADLDRIVSTYHLADDQGGNVVLRVVEDVATARRGGIVDSATGALDLAESLDPRERSAGRRELDRLLRAL
jgi:excisionase family DNA binding protein